MKSISHAFDRIRLQNDYIQNGYVVTASSSLMTSAIITIYYKTRLHATEGAIAEIQVLSELKHDCQ